MLLAGLVIGRWWLIPVSGMVWALLVALTVSITPGDLLFAAALGAANFAVGVSIRRVLVRISQLVRGFARIGGAA